MRLIIAGSRSITDRSVVEEAIRDSVFELSDVDVLVNGDARGVDSLALDIVEEACENQDDVDVEFDMYPVSDFTDEAPNEKVAPLFRNSEMAVNADGLLAVQEGASSGTADMIKKAKHEGLTVDVFRTDVVTLDSYFDSESE